MSDDDKILGGYKLGAEQFWNGTPRHLNPFLIGKAAPDYDLADLFDAGWRAAEREAEGVDKCLAKLENS